MHEVHEAVQLAIPMVSAGGMAAALGLFKVRENARLRGRKPQVGSPAVIPARAADPEASLRETSTCADGVAECCCH